MFQNRLEATLDFLKENSKDGIRVLDCGSRDAETLKYVDGICSAKELIAIDFHNEIKGKIRFLKHDLEKPLPFKDKHFDVVICNDVLEHVENKFSLLAELARVSKGKVVISLPNTQFYRYIKGLIKGSMGKQYNFMIEDGNDRHRWVTYYEDNIRFVESLPDLELEKTIDIVGKHKWPKNPFGKLILFFMIKLMSKKHLIANQVFFLKKV